jgi:hypothetical protein
LDRLPSPSMLASRSSKPVMYMYMFGYVLKTQACRPSALPGGVPLCLKVHSASR